MKIFPYNFANGGEVDITANYGGGKTSWERGRLSIRRVGNQYEAYVRWHIKKEDEILCSGTLKEVVEFTNAHAGLNDTVGE
jgi:hypothetical protein